MRKFVIFALALAMLLPGCTQIPAQVTTTQTMPPVTTTTAAPEPPALLCDKSVFSDWIDAEGLVPHMDNENFDKVIARYSLDGSAVSEIASITEYCANPGSYYSATGDGFSFVNKTELLSKWYYQTNSITVRTPLSGMENPLELDFEITYGEVLAKLLADFDPDTDFVPDAGNRYEMTIYEGIADRLYLKHKGSEFFIIYTQAKVYRHSETKLINVDRKVVLRFRGEERELADIHLEMVESWPAND